jgi:hypothetical protein
MDAIFENFPELRIHQKELFTFALNNKKLQKKLIQAFHNINCKNFTFEEITNPTVPGCTVIFELGIADTKNFTFIDEEETKKMLAVLNKETMRVMDFFCVIRYYREYTSNKKPLKFDYYMTRFNFPEERMLEMQIFHERGPRYIPPKALVTFLSGAINGSSGRKIIKKIES